MLLGYFVLEPDKVWVVARVALRKNVVQQLHVSNDHVGKDTPHSARRERGLQKSLLEKAHDFFHVVAQTVAARNDGSAETTGAFAVPTLRGEVVVQHARVGGAERVPRPEHELPDARRWI